MNSGNNINEYYRRVKARYSDSYYVHEPISEFGQKVEEKETEAGNWNIVIQLRKIVNIHLDWELVFDDGNRGTVTVSQAEQALTVLARYPKPLERLEIQNRLAKSKEEFLRVIST